MSCRSRGQAGVPSNAEAAVINLTAINATEAGYITAYPCGQPRPTASTINYQPGIGARANAAIVQLGTGGKICLYSLKPVDILVDISGWFPANSDYTGRAPTRLLDTRTTGTASSGTTLELAVAGQAGVPSNAEAAVINLTAINGAEAGYVTAYPCGEPRPTASTINYQPGIGAGANAAIVQLGTGGKICLYTSQTVDMLVDISGWFPANSDYTGRAPARLLDTRTTGTASSGTTLELAVAGQAGVPSNAEAAVINLTAINGAEAGYVTAYPCGEPRPTASTINYQPGIGARANAAIVQLGTGGKICLYTSQTVDILVDISGWFPANSDYTGRAPTRLLDTRTPPAQPVPPVTTVPPVSPGGQIEFSESFDNDTGLDRFDLGVYHRNLDDLNWPGGSGGSWTGDHDVNCGSPDTQRPLRLDVGDSAATRRANSFYLCKNHLMTSMGEVDNYSVVWFSPKQVFSSVSSVCFDVNLTDLGTRQWWKVGVVKSSAFDNGSFLVSDIPSSNLPTSLSTSNLLAATWGGQGSAGYPGGKMKIGDTKTDVESNPSPNDKATRHQVCLVDNGNRTVTFTVAGVSATVAGSFPSGPVRVVFYDHNYTPDKDGRPAGHTWHWDNVVVRSAS